MAPKPKPTKTPTQNKLDHGINTENERMDVKSKKNAQLSSTLSRNQRKRQPVATIANVAKALTEEERKLLAEKVQEENQMVMKKNEIERIGADFKTRRFFFSVRLRECRSGYVLSMRAREFFLFASSRGFRGLMEFVIRLVRARENVVCVSFRFVSFRLRGVRWIRTIELGVVLRRGERETPVFDFVFL
jgi:hypothetical protein